MEKLGSKREVEGSKGGEEGGREGGRTRMRDICGEKNFGRWQQRERGGEQW